MSWILGICYDLKALWLENRMAVSINICYIFLPVLPENATFVSFESEWWFKLPRTCNMYMYISAVAIKNGKTSTGEAIASLDQKCSDRKTEGRGENKRELLCPQAVLT